MVAAFTGLGIWQLQRRVEKHALIAMLNERLAAAPEALPARAQWNALTPARTNSAASALARPTRRCRMRWSTAPAPRSRDDVSGPGTWAFLPAQLADGNTVVVNTGFVQNTMQDRDQQDRAVGRLITGDPVDLTGYIRFPESAGTLTPTESVAKRLWFTRDHLAMARALGWGEAGKAVAPFYIDLETPAPESGIPKPGPLSVHLKDDHLQYAITWFTLAFAVVIAFGVWWRTQRRA